MNFEELYNNFSAKLLFFGFSPLFILILINRLSFFINLRFLVLITFFFLISIIPGIGIISFVNLEYKYNISIFIPFIFIFGLGWSMLIGFLLLFIIPKILPLILILLNCVVYILGITYGDLSFISKFEKNIRGYFSEVKNYSKFLYISLLFFSIIQLVLIISREVPIWFEEWDFFKLAIRIGQGQGNITYQYAQPIGPGSEIVNSRNALPVGQKTHSPGLSILFAFAFFSYNDYNSLFSIWIFQSPIWIAMVLITFEYIKKQYSTDIALISITFLIINPKIFRPTLFLVDTPLYMLFFFGFLYYLTVQKEGHLYIKIFFILVLSIIRPEGIIVSFLVIFYFFIAGNYKTIRKFLTSSTRNLYISFILIFLVILGGSFILLYLKTLNLGIWEKISWIFFWLINRSIRETIVTMFIGNRFRDGFILLLPTVLGTILVPGLFYLGSILKLTDFDVNKDGIHYLMFLFGLLVIGIVPPPVKSAVRYGIIYYLPIYYIYVSHAVKFIFSLETFKDLKFNYQENIFNIFKEFNKNPIKRRKFLAFGLIMILCLSGLIGDILFFEGPMYLNKINQDDEIEKASKFVNFILTPNDVLGVQSLWSQPRIFNFGYIELGKANITQLIQNLTITWIWIGPNNDGQMSHEKNGNWFIRQGNLKINESFIESLRLYKKFVYIHRNFSNKVYLLKIVSLTDFVNGHGTMENIKQK